MTGMVFEPAITVIFTDRTVHQKCLVGKKCGNGIHRLGYYMTDGERYLASQCHCCLTVVLSGQRVEEPTGG